MSEQTSRINLHLKAQALSAVRAGNFDEAIEMYQRYLTSDSNKTDDDAWAGMGGAYRRKGNLDLAIDSYEKARELKPESTYALVNIVSLRACRNSPEDREKNEAYSMAAVRAIKQIIAKGDDEFWTWYDLATLQMIQGKTSEAIKTFSYAAERTPQTAKENFRSVLSNLNFIRTYNPSLPGIADAIEILSQHLGDT